VESRRKGTWSSDEDRGKRKSDAMWVRRLRARWLTEQLRTIEEKEDRREAPEEALMSI
jgi:hypothetical protein